jgi:predicted phage-related endonuclease
MNFTVIDCEQKSEPWVLARLGRLTGSRAPAMMTRIKSGESAGRRNLRMALALERVTGKSQDRDFTTPDLEHGEITEPEALGTYEARTGNIVERTGFVSCGAIMAGCSLDGSVNGFEGIVEAKCPKQATHYDYLRTKQIPTDYRWQCLHSLWVTGAQWCDFISYSPFFPEHLQYLCVRLNRNETEIAAYEKEAMHFLAEVSVDVKSIMEMEAA